MPFLLLMMLTVTAQERRPIDSRHPLWFIHVDVWYQAAPQKIINLIPEDIRPYVCLNLSLSVSDASYDKEIILYKMPHYAFQTFKSWATVCQQNEMWFSCQFSSGGWTHVPDDDMVTYEYFFKQFPNFLGWNFAEQFGGFDEAGNKASASAQGRWELFARLVEMSHRYGGFLTISWCGDIKFSKDTSPIAEFKRCPEFLQACQRYPEAILFLYKYTLGDSYYTESVCLGPFISGLTKNYGVRYDLCGWDGALGNLLGENHGKKYPAAAGIGTVMEQTCANGGAVWDGPELTWLADFREVDQTTVDGFQRRNWKRLPELDAIWIDMFRQVLNGTMYIPTREEVVDKTKIVIINDINSGSDFDKYTIWNDIYDGLYRQDDPMNGDNYNNTFFKSTGRYSTISMVNDLYDDVAKKIPLQVKKSEHESIWPTIDKKQQDFNTQYPEVSKGDLYVNRYRNQLVTYTPYSYLNAKTSAKATIPLQYNTCETMELHYDKLSSGIIREFTDHIDFYLNNFRTDTTDLRTDIITIKGASVKPSFTMTKHQTGTTPVEEATTSVAYTDGTYTLTVKHCGPVSLTINCSGNVDRSAIQETAIPLQPTELPKQPTLYRGPIIIEAEDMDFRNVKACVTNYYDEGYVNVRGHSGNGFIDMGIDNNGSLRHYLKLKDGQEGDYHIVMRYTCTKKAGNILISVNGKPQVVRCEQTAENEWRTVNIDATMKVGQNALVITNNNSLPMYIDQVIYQPADVDAMKYGVTILEAEGGIINTDIKEAAEGELITLSINVDEGYLLKELRMVNSVFYTAGKTIPINGTDKITFVMPHDNVTIQPEFTTLSAFFSNVVKEYQLDLVNTYTSMPTGWRCVQENDEIHEFGNEDYGLGARIMEGFNGFQGKALYWRDNCAEYGRQKQYPLTLQKGSYELTYAMAAWKGTPKYKVSIVDLTNGHIIASSDVFTANPNANGDNSADVSGTEIHVLPFDIPTVGSYVISFTDETGGSWNEFLLLECNVKFATPNLTKNNYHEWDGCAATSLVITEDCGGVNRVGENISSGSIIYGDGSVYYTHYADLTNYDWLVIVGTPDMQLRVLMNRWEVGNGGGDNNGGAWTELNPVIETNGMAVINLSGYEFVHLNAIKNGWESKEGTIESIHLIKGDFKQPFTFIANDQTMIYGDKLPELTYNINGNAVDGIPELVTTATRASAVGTYPIMIEEGTITNTKVTYVNGIFTITKAPLAVGVQDVTITEDDAIPTFTLTYNGWKNNDTETTAFTTKPTATTTATATSKAGTYDITVSGGIAQNYELAYTRGTLTILKKEESASTDPADLSKDMYHVWDGCTATSKVIDEDGGGAYNVGKTLSSGVVYGDGSVYYTRYANLTGYNTLLITGTPGMELRVLMNRLEVGNGGGDDNGGAWTELNPVIGTDGTAVVDLSGYEFVHLNAIKTGWGSPEGIIESLKVSKEIFEQPVTVTANNLTMVYGDNVPALTYKSEGAELNGTPKLSTTATKASAVGTYPIKVEAGTVKNTKATYVDGTFTITKAPLTVGVQDVTITEGDVISAFTLTYSGWKNGDKETTAFTTKPTATTTATATSTAGTYDITVSGGATKNYELSYTKGTLTILKKEKPEQPKLAGDANGDGTVNVFDVTAMVNSFLVHPTKASCLLLLT